MWTDAERCGAMRECTRVLLRVCAQTGEQQPISAGDKGKNEDRVIVNIYCVLADWYVCACFAGMPSAALVITLFCKKKENAALSTAKSN